MTELTMCKIDSWWEAPLWHRELSSLLCDDLDGWDGCGWEGGAGKKQSKFYEEH